MRPGSWAVKSAVRNEAGPGTLRMEDRDGARGSRPQMRKRKKGDRQARAAVNR